MSAPAATKRAGAWPAFRAGAQLAAARVRGQFLIVALIALLSTLAVALVERRLASAPLTETLIAVARWAIPLSSFAFIRAARGGARLDDAVWPMARLGLSRRWCAMGLTLTAALPAALVALASASVALVGLHGRVQGAADVGASLWICALSSLAYVGWFSLGSCWGRRGGWAWSVLVLDFILGGGDGVLAMPFPRGHARSLLGGASVVELPQPSSSVALLLMACLGVLLASARQRD